MPAFAEYFVDVLNPKFFCDNLYERSKSRLIEKSDREIKRLHYSFDVLGKHSGYFLIPIGTKGDGKTKEDPLYDFAADTLHEVTSDKNMVKKVLPHTQKLFEKYGVGDNGVVIVNGRDIDKHIFDIVREIPFGDLESSDKSGLLLEKLDYLGIIAAKAD